MINIDKNILKQVYKKRDKNARKYDSGLLLVIGGSELYSGAPALAGLSAFRTGVDMVRIIAPKRAADIIAGFTPDLAAYPLKGSYLQESHLSELISMTESARIAAREKAAVVIGGGVGRSEETQKVIFDYLSKISLPAVIDAEAIYSLSKNPNAVFGKPFLITPNTYEFFMLTGRQVYDLPDEEKIKVVQEEAEHFGTTILLKGKTDIISNGREIALNKFGSPYLSKGGCGDTLAGIAGALMAKGIPAFLAAQAAAYLNVAAGEAAIKKLGAGDSLTATDLIKAIPKIIK